MPPEGQDSFLFSRKFPSILNSLLLTICSFSPIPRFFSSGDPTAPLRFFSSPGKLLHFIDFFSHIGTSCTDSIRPHYMDIFWTASAFLFHSNWTDQLISGCWCDPWPQSKGGSWTRLWPGRKKPRECVKRGRTSVKPGLSQEITASRGREKWRWSRKFF